MRLINKYKTNIVEHNNLTLYEFFAELRSHNSSPETQRLLSQLLPNGSSFVLILLTLTLLNLLVDSFVFKQ